MKPTIVLVGRPNVGKSTLFNRLTRTRDAIVADMPGLTRDRHYGQGRVGAKPFIAVDTGGLEPDTREGIFSVMAQQVALAIDEADAIVFVVDGRQGLTPQDRVIAERLRATGRRIWIAVNKSEGMDRNAATGEFHELGLGDPLAISAAHGEGVTDFMELVLEPFPPEPPEPEEARHPRIAVVGRPNVGKSTLVNRLLGEERVIAFDTPGTTRDAIEIGFERDGRPYTLIDTAGVRKRGRVDEAVEKFSVVKTLQAIADANVVVLVLDARQGIAEQDAHVAGFVLEAGRALVVAVNKWDGLGEYERAQAKQAVSHILAFLDFAQVHYISARAGTGVNSLMASVDSAYASAMAKLSTPRLTRALMAATARQAPPRSGLVRPKLRYAHQGGVNPPRVIIHGNALERLPETYKRYLERYFRRTFKLEGTPLKIEWRSSRNPFAGKRS